MRSFCFVIVKVEDYFVRLHAFLQYEYLDRALRPEYIPGNHKFYILGTKLNEHHTFILQNFIREKK